MLVIDGAQGEGGGQIIRSSLSLSIVTGLPFRAVRVRAGRKNPGLQPQHLASVHAAAQISNASVSGAAVGSREFVFEPREVKGGEFHFAIGTAGSTSLVLQTVLPPLLMAGTGSTLVLEGGTHNPMAPPYEFLESTYLPLIARMGPRLSCRLEKYGFYPKGGGRVIVTIEPSNALLHLALIDVTGIRRLFSKILLVNLPEHIGKREAFILDERFPALVSAQSNSLASSGEMLSLPNAPPDERRPSHMKIPPAEIVQSSDSRGCGNMVSVFVDRHLLTETITSLGERGLRAEKVAESALARTFAYIRSQAPVGPFLQDQLLLPLALAGSGSYLTGALTEHTLTNIAVIRKFLQVEIETRQHGENSNVVEVRPANVVHSRTSQSQKPPRR